jgi:hypothetical protein
VNVEASEWPRSELSPGNASVEKHRRQGVLADNAGGNAEDEVHQFLLIECQIPAIQR